MWINISDSGSYILDGINAIAVVSLQPPIQSTASVLHTNYNALHIKCYRRRSMAFRWLRLRHGQGQSTPGRMHNKFRPSSDFRPSGPARRRWGWGSKGVVVVVVSTITHSATRRRKKSRARGWRTVSAPAVAARLRTSVVRPQDNECHTGAHTSSLAPSNSHSPSSFAGNLNACVFCAVRVCVCVCVYVQRTLSASRTKRRECVDSATSHLESAIRLAGCTGGFGDGDSRGCGSLHCTSATPRERARSRTRPLRC